MYQRVKPQQKLVLTSQQAYEIYVNNEVFNLSLQTISTRNISARVISAWTFHHGNISAHAPFGAADIPADGLLPQECFDMRNFRHREFSAQWTFQHRHFGTCAIVPKCPCAEMSPCRNVPVPKIPCAKKSLCQKVPMSKCSRVELSICRNVCSAEWCTCRNVPVMKHPCRNESCRKVPC